MVRGLIAALTAMVVAVVAGVAFGWVPGSGSAELTAAAQTGHDAGHDMATAAALPQDDATTAAAKKATQDAADQASKQARKQTTSSTTEAAAAKQAAKQADAADQADQASGATTTSTDHAMSAMSMPKGTWINVDKAAWKAQLAEFDKTKARKAPATAKQNTEFNATCTYSHSGKNDAIVFPGQPGKSHLHSFLGNKSADANTTLASLMKFTSTTCVPKKDHSAYWVPSLTNNKTGKAVQPSQLIVYYGSLLDDANKKKTVPMPNGLRMIYGDASLQKNTPAGSQNAFYCSGGPLEGKSRSTDGNWPVCGDGGTVHFMMRFPDCWDGKHLDSPDHKSHVSYGQQGDCPKAFPVRIPAVTWSIYYPTHGVTAGFSLSSGKASSMHGDAFFAWDTKTMADRVKSCVRQMVTCASNGEF
ncbi:DUF1996 domain-containing protein [Kineosporia sp. J2-2]|uniref:DUF1996 domain-containing protein n=1 Tax=Kineosporia corallincola TaxID=2835133 RepID=A0ABS5TI58_9ACTN|nr:DUF1996 domain-containing protein [Kineosporia corallincola]MBT0770782.1 DUF1996 domain-containing protein [Kineosporia corallincola]